MPTIRYVLCPIDFSEASRHALGHAAAVAGWFGSTLVGIHVSDPDLETVAGVTPHAGARLADWLSPMTAAGIANEGIVTEGSAAPQILDRAAALPADLIVMGTHGSSGFARLLLGSVTERVLRQATCPVMTVPPPAVATSLLPYKRLLCPVDFSEASLEAVRFAVSLAQESTALVTLLHVIEWPPDDALRRLAGDAVSQFCRERDARLRARLDSLIRQDVRNWCTVDVQLREGKPYEQIVGCADTGYDLVVMGAHARGPLARWWLGATTNHVVRQATCPVVTVREPSATR